GALRLAGARSLGAPFRPHLREPVHVDGGPLTGGLIRERLQQGDGLREIAEDGALRGVEVEPFDFVEWIHATPQLRRTIRPSVSMRNGSTVAPPDASVATTSVRR